MTVFWGLEICGAAARPGGGKAARPGVQSTARPDVQSTINSPGPAGSEVCAQRRASQTRGDFYSNWHTRGFKNLAVCFPVSR